MSKPEMNQTSNKTKQQGTKTVRYSSGDMFNRAASQRNYVVEKAAELHTEC